VSRVGRIVLLVVLATMAVFANVASASAQEFDVTEFTVTSDDNAAGGHPDLTTAIRFTETTDDLGNPVPTGGQFRDLIVDLPAGFSGDPLAVPRCTEEEFQTFQFYPGIGPGVSCPKASQIGYIDLLYLNNTTFQRTPVFNMEPLNDNQTARLALTIGGNDAYIVIRVRGESDYGLQVMSFASPNNLQVRALRLTSWGVPADSSHDADRMRAGNSTGVPDPGPVEIEPKPFFTNPTRCGALEPVTMRANSYDDPDTFVEAATTVDMPDQPPPAEPDQLIGCDDLAFDPSISVVPNRTEADSPSGYEVQVSLPQASLADQPTTSHLRDAVVTLPEGVSVSPASANGLVACTDAQLRLGEDAAAACPDAAKIGTTEFIVPALPGPLRGSVYVRPQIPGKIFRIALTGDGFGVHLKLLGDVTPDPVTGQLTTTFVDNPQQPFSEFRVRFFGGPHAALANPPTCGTFTASATFTPWSGGPDAVATDSYEINSGPNGTPCATTRGARPLDLEMSAGMINPLAGASSPFVFRISRPDGHQEISSIDTSLPPGIAAVLRGVPLCPEPQASEGTCGEESRVGSVLVGSGPGSDPIYLPGRVYLTGPYKGAPLGLSIVTPAVAGPYDLGTVISRAATFVDRRDASLDVVTDPLPQIIEGVPLRLRDIRLFMDRPNFMVSPTSCEEQQVNVTVHGSHGASATESERFQLGGCERLGFRPKLKTKLTGKGASKRSHHPQFNAIVKLRPGDANIRFAQLTLPKVLLLDQASLATICTRAQFAADACPPETVFGHAKAISPLLPEPLEGDVTLVASDNPLPDLVGSLRGIVRIDVPSRTDSINGRIRNTFDFVPDTAVDRFDITVFGGPGGLLVNARSLCAKVKKGKNAGEIKVWRSKFITEGWNGAKHKQRPKLQVKCGKKGSGQPNGR
jgi:hypothetical protein